MGTQRPYNRHYDAYRRRHQRDPCALCGHLPERWQPPNDIDHITPLVQGGIDASSNYRVLCRKCNRSRGARLGNKQRARNRAYKSNRW